MGRCPLSIFGSRGTPPRALLSPPSDTTPSSQSGFCPDDSPCDPPSYHRVPVERGGRERRERERERERERTGYEPFALHDPIRWLILGYVIKDRG